MTLEQVEAESKGYPYPMDRVPDTLQDQEKEQDKKGSGSEEGVQGEILKGEVRSSIPGSTVIPAVLDTDEFRAVWVRWLGHLKQKKSPATIHAQDLQLNRLAQMGIPKAIATINHCIEKNWKGIYEHGDEAHQPNTARSHRPLTGAEQRLAGIPEVNKGVNAADLFNRAQQRDRVKNGVAETPPPP